MSDIAGGGPRSWTTSLAKVEDNRVVVRGHDLNDLIGNIGFAGMSYLMFTGEMPTPGQAAVLEAVFVAVIDHGISPSSTVTRYLASCGVPLQVAVSGGVMTFGDIHGGAGQELARQLAENIDADTSAEGVAKRLVTDFRSRGMRVPGFGHPQHVSGDPRVPRIIEVSRRNGVAGRFLDVAEAMGLELAALLGRPVYMNIDGVIAATLLDLGLDWRYARALLYVPRTVGLTAHAIEERDREPGWRHVPASDVLYDGALPGL
jgi:citrate synthase